MSKGTDELPYTKVPNDILQDPNLSARAKGLFAYLMSLPDTWIIYKRELYNHFKEGREAIIKAFQELVEYGVIVSEERCDESGKFVSRNYRLAHNGSVSSYNRPVPRKPLPRKPEPKKPEPENPSLIKKHKEIKHKDNKYISFVGYLNKKLNRSFRGDKKSMGQFNARIKEGYTAEDFAKAVNNILQDEYHKESNFKYVTPEFMTRVDKLEKFMNLPTKNNNNNNLFGNHHG